VIVDGPTVPAVVVPAAVCARLERALLDAAAKARRLGLEVDPGAAQTIDDISTAAAWWRASAAIDQPRKRPDTQAPMTTADAAARLDVTPARVRQRLRTGELAGERDARGRWHIDPAALQGASQ
jgi:hypothetical protein